MVEQCKKARISSEEALKPSEGCVSTPPRGRRQKMLVRRKEVVSNPDVVPLTSDSDDVADVAIVQIEHGKGIRLWIQTPNKHLSK